MKYIFFKHPQHKAITIWSCNSLEDKKWTVLRDDWRNNRICKLNLLAEKLADGAGQNNNSSGFVKVKYLVQSWRNYNQIVNVYNSMEELATVHFEDLL